MRYQTMTPDGGTGSDVTADDDEAARAQAEGMGYKVVDITDTISPEYDAILVIAD
jgi:hypothetical protein